MYKILLQENEKELIDVIVKAFTNRKVFFSQSSEPGTIGHVIETYLKTQVLSDKHLKVKIGKIKYNADAIFMHIPVECKSIKINLYGQNKHVGRRPYSTWVAKLTDDCTKKYKHGVSSGGMFSPNEMEALKNGIPVLLFCYIELDDRIFIREVDIIKGNELYEEYKNKTGLTKAINKCKKNILTNDLNDIRNITTINCNKDYVTNVIKTSTGEIKYGRKLSKICVKVSKLDPKVSHFYKKTKDGWVEIQANEAVNDFLSWEGETANDYFVKENAIVKKSKDLNIHLLNNRDTKNYKNTVKVVNIFKRYGFKNFDKNYHKLNEWLGKRRRTNKWTEQEIAYINANCPKKYLEKFFGKNAS